jgi:DNA invertase Pin-like site-specific DNA recombinase
MTNREVNGYARQSADQSGEGAAVSRQLDGIKEMCKAKDLTLVEMFTDNDISATTGKTRPGFEALLASQPARPIVVWHVDRLCRVSKDLERVIDLGRNVYAVKSGHVDLSNPAGRAVARTITAWSTYEGEQKATRMVAANRQRAQQGDVSFANRPYGFTRTGRKPRIVKSEAAEIRNAVAKLLKGASMQSLVDDLNARGSTTTAGGPWSVTTLRRVLANPRVAGRVVYNGEDFGSNGMAILDPDTADRLGALLHDPRRNRTPSNKVKYLLSGLVRCGRQGCDDSPMFSKSAHVLQQKKAGRDRMSAMAYRCLACHSTRRQDRVDEVVMAAVVARLTRPDAVGLLDRNVDVTELREQVVELRERRDGLAALLAEGLLTRDAVRAQAGRLTNQIGDIERQMESAIGTSPIAKVVDSGNVKEALAKLSLLEVREVVKALMVVRVLPCGRGVRFSPEQIQIEWKGQP